MTYAPETLLEVRRYLKSIDSDLSDSEVGITGGPSHVATGTSYHLGADQLKMYKNPYSARNARDRRGLMDPEIRNAACAIDIDDDWDHLRPFSVWAVEQCRAGTLDTLDIREIIYSPDGVQVLRWDRERGQQSQPQPDTDLSHRTHTHISRYRDATRNQLVPLFQRFYAGVTTKRVIDMFFLQAAGDPAVYVSDGIRTRNMPAGTWDSTCVPLMAAGVPFLNFPSMGALLDAGGPLETAAALPPEVTVTVPAQTIQVKLETGGK